MAALAKKRMELASVPNFDAPFLSQAANKENADMNQYWYSQSSIQVPSLSLRVSMRAHRTVFRLSPPKSSRSPPVPPSCPLPVYFFRFQKGQSRPAAKCWM
jgi:hypothetical protein